MKIFIVNYKRSGYSDERSITVAANTIDKALIDFNRYAKKNWYSTEVLDIKLDKEVGIFYKS